MQTALFWQGGSQTGLASDAATYPCVFEQLTSKVKMITTTVKIEVEIDDRCWNGRGARHADFLRWREGTMEFSSVFATSEADWASFTSLPKMISAFEVRMVSDPKYMFSVDVGVVRMQMQNFAGVVLICYKEDAG
mmetsp:Transcript_29640/g.39561  ORF Transcript_29640/g.39561 Transcript_29640/m.39561 type:complete len:135 (-) Transcript_29640:93-497(-)